MAEQAKKSPKRKPRVTYVKLSDRETITKIVQYQRVYGTVTATAAARAMINSAHLQMRI